MKTKKAVKTVAATPQQPTTAKFVIAALGHGFLTGLKDPVWSDDRSLAMEFDTFEQAETSIKARRTSAGFPQHAGVSPGPNGITATLDPGAKAALAQLFPRLREVDIKDSPYKLLEPIDGVKAKDLTVAERAAMAERLNLVGKKLPKYAPKISGMSDAVKNAKAAGVIPKEMREKMEKVGKGAAAIMQKAEKQRAAEKKAAKADSKGKPPKKAAANGGAPKGRGIGAFCEGLLLKKKSADDILAAVQKEFPGAKTSMASIAWYRNKLINEGQLSKD